MKARIMRGSDFIRLFLREILEIILKF